MKIIDKSSCAGKEGMIQTEVSILRQINHPHIIPLYDMYETEHNILLVMQMYNAFIPKRLQHKLMLF